MTATPLREDGVDVKDFFNGDYTFELNLWNAIEEGYLSDFNYYMIKDETTDLTGVDLRDEIKMVEKLSTEKRQDFILENYQKLIQENSDNKTIVFCYSIDHAIQMTNYFNRHKFVAKTLTSRNSFKERETILREFENSQIDFLCVVDVLNEGIDIKDINNVMFLRPTESKSLFIQQMGRGLRKNVDKVLNILDFVNNIDMSINKNANPLSRLNTIVNEEINSFELSENTFLQFINSKLPGNSSFKLIGKSAKQIIMYLKHNNRSRIELKENLEKLNIQTYEQYIDYFENNNLKPQNVYEFNLKRIATIDSFVLKQNNQHQFKTKIMFQFAYMNNIFLIRNFIKIIKEKKLTSDFLTNNLFVVSFLSEIESNNSMEKFKKKYGVTEVIDFIFENQNETLLKEISFLLKYRLEKEYRYLIANKESFKGSLFTWQQTKAFAKHVNYEKNQVWNMKRTSGFESLATLDTEISIYTDDKNAYKNENIFNYHDEYKRDQNVLFWYAPGGKSGWKINQLNKNRAKLLTQGRVINCFHKDANLINKFGPKICIYEFIGHATILRKDWKEDNQEVYWFNLN